MPTNRNRRKRANQGMPLDESIEQFLFSGEAEKDTAGWDLKVSRFFGIEEIETAWLQHKDFLLKKWKSEKRKEIPWVVSWLEWKKPEK